MGKTYNIGENNGMYGKRPMNYVGYIISKKSLYNMYRIKRLTIKQIANEVKCSYNAIRYRLIEFNIPIRTFSEAFKGLKKSIKHRKAISQSNKGKHNNKGKLNPNYGKKHPGLNKGIKFTDNRRKNMSLAKKGKYNGKNNPHFGKPIRPNWGIYKGINMRSSWEVLFAQFLDLSGIKYLYEPKTFDLGYTTYTPDFYLPELDFYIEIKGYFPIKTKKKLELFKKLYPNINFSILQGKELSKLGILIEERFIK